MNKLETIIAVGFLGGAIFHGASGWNEVESSKSHYSDAKQAFVAGDTNKGNELRAQAGSETDQGLLDGVTFLVMGGAGLLSLSNASRRKL